MQKVLHRARTRMQRKSLVASVALLLQTEPGHENIPIVVHRFVWTLFLDSLQSNLTHCFAFQKHAQRL